jgi:hypothetical protein
MRAVAVSVLVLAIVGVTSEAQSPPNLSEVLERAARFVATLEQTIPAVAVDERYAQSAELTRNLGGSTIGATNVGAQPGTNSMIEGGMIRVKRATRSELLLVRTSANPATWTGVRNILDVDGTPTGNEPDRLARLAADARVLDQQWPALVTASRAHLVGPVERGLFVVLCPLSLLRADQQSRVAFKKDGEEKVRGTATWKVTFIEQKGPSLLRTSGNVQVPSRGTLWIVPGDGRILRTRLEVGSGLSMEQWRVDADYSMDPTLGIPLPFEAKERYENQNGRVEVKVTYSSYRAIGGPR